MLLLDLQTHTLLLDLPVDYCAHLVTLAQSLLSVHVTHCIRHVANVRC